MLTRSRPLSTALTVAWVGYTLLLGILYSLLPPNPDQAIFDYVGWILTQGGALYIDVAEQNFPGKMWLHALSTWLFGNHAWSYRTLDYLLLLPACWVLYLISRRASGSRLAWIVVPLYQTMYVTSGIWEAGTRDLIGAHMLLAGGYAYYLRAIGRSMLWLLLFGGLCAAAFLTRPTYALFPVMVVGVDAIAAWLGQRVWRAVILDALIGTGILVGILGCVALAGWRTGQLEEWYGLAVSFNVNVYSNSATFFELSRTLFLHITIWHWYLAFGLAGSWLWFRGNTARPLWSLSMITGATAVLSAYAQRKGFGYHFAGLLPVLGLFVAFFISWAVARIRGLQDVPRLLLGVSVCAIAIVGLMRKQRDQLGPQLSWILGRGSKHEMMAVHGYADTFEVAELVANSVAPEDRVLVWSRAVHINYLAQRKSPTRFITIWMLDLIPDRFALGKTWVDEFEQAFLTHAPEVVVLDAPGADGGGLLARAEPSEAVRFLGDQVRSRYRLETTIGLLEVYRLIHEE